MNTELDHFFILVKAPDEAAQKLLDIGMHEGASNTHPGQGTANRRFYFSNSMLELLMVRDADEAENGTAKKLRFPQRVADQSASPFGVILTRTDNLSKQMPFAGWPYQPDYFPEPQAFHVANNSENLNEPLCFYVPFAEPQKRTIVTKRFGSIDKILINIPSNILSNEIIDAAKADRLFVQSGASHLMEVFFSNAQEHQCEDLRPHLPLILHF